MHTYPKIMPNELLASYVTRVATMTGLKENRKLFENIISSIDEPIQHTLSLSARIRGAAGRYKRHPIFIRKPQCHLKFCPSCREKDLEFLGFTYFRNYHQLAIFLVCPLHDCFMETAFGNERQSRSGGKIHEIQWPDHKEDLKNIANITVMIHEYMGGLFMKHPIQNYLENIIFMNNLNSFSERDKFYGLYLKNASDLIKRILYNENHLFRIEDCFIRSSRMRHEELIVYYYFLSENPSPEHFIRLVENNISNNL